MLQVGERAPEFTLTTHQGKRVSLGRRSTASREEPPPLVIGDGATIGAGAVLVAGAAVGAGAVVGDQAHLRERSAVAV